MKNYRFVIPVLIILAFVGSIFYLYNTREEKEIQYNEYLKIARENRKNDIPAVAEENYLLALDIKDSLELFLFDKWILYEIACIHNFHVYYTTLLILSQLFSNPIAKICK